MAVRGVDPVEERKSYGTIFFLGICLLLGLSLWALHDDNFSRRPWKKYQAEFYSMDYAKAQAAYDEEDKSLRRIAITGSWPKSWTGSAPA